jgi:hypothetical protein
MQYVAAFGPHFLICGWAVLFDELRTYSAGRKGGKAMGFEESRPATAEGLSGPQYLLWAACGP